MQFVIVFTTILLLLVFHSVAKEYCLAPSFTTTIRIVNSELTATQIVYLDGHRNLARFDMSVGGVEKEELLFRYDKKLLYKIDAATKACSHFPLTTDLTPWCMLDGTNVTATGKIAGSLPSLQLVGHLSTSPFPLTRFTVVETDSELIPIDLLDYADSFHLLAIFQQFWDYKGYDSGLPDPSVFDIPKSCETGL